MEHLTPARWSSRVHAGPATGHCAGRRRQRLGLGLVVLAAAACNRGPGIADLEATIAAAATGAASVDLGAVLAWAPVAHNRARFFGREMETLLAAAETCGVELSRARATVSWHPGETNLVLTAPGVGREGLLGCVGEATAGGPVTIADTRGIPMLEFAGQQWTARGLDRDTLRIWSSTVGASGPGLMGLAEDSPLAALIGGDAAGRPLWFATAEADATPLAEAFAVAAALDGDGAQITVHSHGSDAATSERVGRLRSLAAAWSQQVHVPSGLAERLEVDAGDDGLRAAVSLPSALAYAIDVRWLVTPPAQPMGPEPERTASDSVIARVFGPEPMGLGEPMTAIPTVAAAADGSETIAGGRFVKLGVAECDAYIEYYVGCIDDKMPEAAKKASLEALTKAVEAWREALNTPGAADGLAEACTSIADAMRPTCS